MVDYSTLELVTHDPTANAPEHDNASLTRQPYLNVQKHAYELGHDTGLPEAKDAPTAFVYLDQKEKQPHSEDQHGNTPAPSRQRPAYTVIAIVCGLLALIAIGIGVGVGLGLRSNSNRDDNTAASSMNSAPEGSLSLILDDTSLAAVTTWTGDRRLFFQERGGAIRQAFFDAVTERWSVDPNQIVVSEGARLRTPISAQTIPTDPDLNPNILRHEDIRIHYITVSDTVGTAVIRDNSIDEIGLDPMFEDILNYTSSSTARSLSVSYKPNPSVFDGNSPNQLIRRADFEAIVMLELPGDDIAVLLGHGLFDAPLIAPTENNVTLGFPISHTGTNESRWRWRDITNEVRNREHTGSVGSMLDLKSPFSSKNAISSRSLYPLASNFSINMVFFDLSSAPDHTGGTETGYNEGNLFTLQYQFDAGNDTITYDNRDNIRRSDFEVTYVWGEPGELPDHSFFFWVNGTTLSQFGILMVDSELVQEQGPFPFPRLASTTAANSSTFYLYNQLNESSFAQRSWDANLGTWNTIEYITIQV